MNDKSYNDLPVEELKQRILRLKKEKNAVILTHNYQVLDVQDIGDFRGDSLGLSIEASRTEADIIVFCGVDFMAQSAKILSPPKTVLLPDLHAGCPMAAMIDGETLKIFHEKSPFDLPSREVLCVDYSVMRVPSLFT